MLWAFRISCLAIFTPHHHHFFQSYFHPPEDQQNSEITPRAPRIAKNRLAIEVPFHCYGPEGVCGMLGPVLSQWLGLEGAAAIASAVLGQAGCWMGESFTRWPQNVRRRTFLMAYINMLAEKSCEIASFLVSPEIRARQYDCRPARYSAMLRTVQARSPPASSPS